MATLWHRVKIDFIGLKQICSHFWPLLLNSLYTVFISLRVELNRDIYHHHDYIKFILSHRTCTRLFWVSNLQFQAEEHSKEDKAETEEADGQADQPSEQSSLPGWVVELLTASYRTATLHSLQRQQRRREQTGQAEYEIGGYFGIFVIIWSVKMIRGVLSQTANSLYIICYIKLVPSVQFATLLPIL